MTAAAELRDLSTDELRHRGEEARQELFNLRFQHATGQLDNYRRPGQLRKEVALIETLLRQRELESG